MKEELVKQLYSMPVYAIRKITEPVMQFLFENSSGKQPALLFLLNVESASSEEKLTMEKITSISRLAKVEQAAYMNLRNEAIAAIHIFNLKIPLIISLGCPASQIGLQIDPPKNKVIRLRGVDFIFTNSILQMEQNSKLKMEFWKSAFAPYYRIQPEKK